MLQPSTSIPKFPENDHHLSWIPQTSDRGDDGPLSVRSIDRSIIHHNANVHAPTAGLNATSKKVNRDMRKLVNEVASDREHSAAIIVCGTHLIIF